MTLKHTNRAYTAESSRESRLPIKIIDPFASVTAQMILAQFVELGATDRPDSPDSAASNPWWQPHGDGN